jgi:hypothetical protein
MGMNIPRKILASVSRALGIAVNAEEIGIRFIEKTIKIR